MEVIVNSDSLKKQISSMQGIMAKKGTVSILSNIKIVAEDSGDLVMTATDLDVSLISRQEVDILQTGSICLSGKKLGRIVGTLPNEPVHLKLDYKSERVEFVSGRFKGKLVGLDTDHFPEIICVEGESVKISASVLYDALRRAKFAVTENAGRFIINGVLLLIGNSELKVVSTDGHRLCLFKMMLASSENIPDLKCLIPIKAVRELIKILSVVSRSNGDSEILIKKGNQLEFQVGDKIMLAREVTGSFPDWEKVVPNDFESFAEINSGEFLDALVRVAVLADDQNRPVELEFSSDKVRLKAESSEVGFSTEEVSCEFRFLEEKKGKCERSLKVSFNAKYLIDFFSIHGVKSKDFRVVWKFGRNGSQVLLTFIGEEKMFSYILVSLKG